MITVEWREEFNTGVAAVDFEHQELVENLNALLQTIQSGGTDNKTRDMISGLYAQVSGHFALEETIMQKVAYDEYESHKYDHEDLLDQIRDLMEAHASGEYVDKAEQFAENMYDWFINHFKTKDARLHELIPHS